MFNKYAPFHFLLNDSCLLKTVLSILPYWFIGVWSQWGVRTCNHLFFSLQSLQTCSDESPLILTWAFYSFPNTLREQKVHSRPIQIFDLVSSLTLCLGQALAWGTWNAVEGGYCVIFHSSSTGHSFPGPLLFRYAVSGRKRLENGGCLLKFPGGCGGPLLAMMSSVRRIYGFCLDCLRHLTAGLEDCIPRAC